METCPICLIEHEKVIISSKNATKHVICPRCGIFVITYSALSQLENGGINENLWKLSYWIKRGQKNDNPVDIKGDIKSILQGIVLPKPHEQAERLILYTGNNIESPEESIERNPHFISSIIGAHDAKGVVYIAKHLIDEGVFQEDPLTINFSEGLKISIDDHISLGLTIEGWDKFDEISKRGIESNKVFMAMKYKDETLNNFYNDYLKPAVEKTGFELFRLDEDKKAGLIDDKMRVYIRNSRFLIADLSHHNPGAYWEAGYAEGFGKPVIYLCEKTVFDDPERKPHFDTNHHLTIVWDKEKLSKAAEDLKATIRATLPGIANMTDDLKK